MNNFDDEKEQEISEEDIEFDDDIDIEALQKQLQTHLATNVEVASTEITPVESQPVVPQSIVPELAQPELPTESDNTLPETIQENNKDKKYVIYITPENIDFMESLNIVQRKNIINAILHEQDEVTKKQKINAARKQFTKHVVITILTIIIGFPILMTILNKSIQITITNYQQSQQNFIKLYKEQGKIKSYDKFKDKF